MANFHNDPHKDSAPAQPWRELDLFGGFQNSSDKYPSNKLISSRFTFLNIIPKSIFEELQKFSNLWFLFIVIISFINPLDSLWHKLSRLIPLIFVLGITLFKDISKLYHQQANDTLVNNKSYLVWNGKEFEEKLAMDIMVSDILAIMDRNVVPADMLLFYVENQGECFADTFQVLGERNLQVKKPIKDIQENIRGADFEEVIGNLQRINGTVFVRSHLKAGKSVGRIKLRHSPKATILNYQNVLLRGSIVCNTPWMIGYVIATGADSCFSLESQKKKTSVCDKILERLNIYIIIFMLLLTLLNFLISILCFKLEYPEYLLFGFLKQVQNLVPISLYLSILLIRIIRAYIINKGQQGIYINNPTYLEDLGHVDYIIANKTGTLTSNELSAQVCVVQSKIYWKSPPDDPEDNQFFLKCPLVSSPPMLNFIDLQKECESSSIFHFLVCMAVCNHTTAKGMGEEYFSLLTDDKVLVETALMLGMKLLSRSSSVCTLNFNGAELEFLVLGSQSFNSEIKKCRIVIKDKKQDCGYLYIKGSKEDMLDLLNLTHEEKTNIEEFTLSKSIIRMRTVIMGYKELSGKDLEEFDFAYQTAASSPINSYGRVDGVFEQLEQMCEYLGIVAIEDLIDNETRECLDDISKSGAKVWITSGDDEESTFNAGVSSRVFEENVRIVRLTNFSNDLEMRGVMSQLIKENIYHRHPIKIPSSISFIKEFDDDESEGYKIRSEPLIFGINNTCIVPENQEGIDKNTPSNTFRDIQGLIPQKEVNRKQLNFNPDSVYYVLSVDSTGLEYGISSEESKKFFISLLFAAHCVCFHSLQSDQKTKVIKLLKENFSFSPVVLAISEGQCDLGMLQEAHIGVSLNKANSSLRNFSDFSLSHFSQLRHLLLSQGHWSSMNLVTIVMYSLYSKFMLATVLVLYNTMSEFSADVLIGDENIVIYWILLPFLQMVFVGIYDRDLEEKQLREYPQVYSIGVFHEILGVGKVLENIFEGIFHGFVLSLFYYLAAFKSIGPDGRVVSNDDLSILINICMFIICTTRLIFETNSLSFLTLLGHFLSIITLIIHILCKNYLSGTYNDFFYTHQHHPALIFAFFLTPLIIFFLQAAVKYTKSLFWPNILDYIKNIQFKQVNFALISRLEFYKNKLFHVFKKSPELGNKNSIDSLALSRITLRFQSAQNESEYNEGKAFENIKTYRAILSCGCILISILTLAISLISSYKVHYIEPVLPCLIIIYIIISIYSFSSKFKNFFKFLISLHYLLSLIFLLIASQLYSFSMIQATSVLLIAYSIALNSDWFNSLLLSILSLLISSYISTQFYTQKEYPVELSILFIISFLALLLNTSAVGYSIDKTKRLEFILIRKVEAEVDKSKSVLSYLLPAFVRKRVKDGVRYISEDQGIVSIFFCDIMDFEDIVAGFTPVELTAFLDDVFGKLDQICRVVGVTKIETVGKTYMACAGLKESEEEMDPYFVTVTHARRAVEMGLAVIRIVNSIQVRRGVTLSVKIGIHSGAVAAGVIGFHKPQFSLVGDTVNTASRMASTCSTVNTIQISNDCYNFINDKNGLVFTQKTVEAKGKGAMTTWLVRLPVGIAETALYELPNKQPSGKPASSPSQPSRSVSIYPRNNFIESTTMHETRLSALLTHLDVSDPKQLFLRKDTELIEQVQWISFSCSEKVKERKFRLETVENNQPVIRFAMVVTVICNALSIVVYAVSAKYGRITAYYFIIKLAIEVFCEAMLIIGLRWHLKQLWFAWSLQLVYFISTVAEIAILIVEPRDISLAFISYLNHIFLFSHCAELFFKHNFWSLLLVTILWLIYIEINFPIDSLITSLFSLTATSTLIFTTYTSERNLRINSTLKAAANKELDKTEKLIKQMMPPHVVQNLKDQSSITDKIPQVTILYADIVGFTAWSSTRTPEEIVTMLSELFTQFDKNCVSHEVYKVHTIGDCYVAMGYTGQASRNFVQECINIIEFARQTLEIIQEVNAENGIGLNMRIGIHTGDVTAGVTGTNIVRYDIYGSDVMIANKVESSGVPGKISVSEATKNIIDSSGELGFQFNPHGEFFVKAAKKKINTFLLEE